MRTSLAARALLLALLAGAAQTAQAQDRGAAAATVFHKRFFVSYQSATLRDVLLDNGFETGTPVKADGTGGSALGAGASWLLSDNRFLLQVAYDRAAAKFGDRTLALNSVDFTVGYAFRWPVPVVPYFTFGPGWYKPQKYTDYTSSAALGVKVGFLNYFALNAELRNYWEDTGGGCGTNCYYVNAPKPKDYATRASMGLQVYFGRMGHASK